MKLSLRTYTAYSIGCAVVWAAILAAVNASRVSKDTKRAFSVGFMGWASGWCSATIARFVYPPPRSRQSRDVAS